MWQAATEAFEYIGTILCTHYKNIYFIMVYIVIVVHIVVMCTLVAFSSLLNLEIQYSGESLKLILNSVLIFSFILKGTKQKYTLF